MDLLPTCAKLAGAALPDRPLDGVDISPLLFGTGSVARDAFFYYRGTTLYAARLGPWKAHFITRSGYGSDQAQPHDPPLLYHLGEDPGERWDRAATQPEALTKIQEAVARQRATLQAAPTQLAETVATP
jgi:arylsulfatase A-like enzyme